MSALRLPRIWFAAILGLLLAGTLLPAPAVAGDLQPLGSIKFSGEVHAADDISGIGFLGSSLLIGGDEPQGDTKENAIQLLVPDGNGYKVSRNIGLLSDGELDIEDIACAGSIAYVVGSHSSKRERVKEDKTYKKNRERIAEIETESQRDLLYRIKFDAGAMTQAVDSMTLSAAIKANAVLEPYRNIPGKENGVDIEGLAVLEDWLYAGFRSPVLRDNYVPVMRFQFDGDPNGIDVYFVTLDGRGIRGMCGATGRVLILAGPPAEGQGTYRIYEWDGRDCLPGTDRPIEIGRCVLLGELPQTSGKPEGIVVQKENQDSYDVLIVSDGAPNGVCQSYRVPKPQP